MLERHTEDVPRWLLLPLYEARIRIDRGIVEWGEHTEICCLGELVIFLFSISLCPMKIFSVSPQFLFDNFIVKNFVFVSSILFLYYFYFFFVITFFQDNERFLNF